MACGMPMWRGLGRQRKRRRPALRRCGASAVTSGSGVGGGRGCKGGDGSKATAVLRGQNREPQRGCTGGMGRPVERGTAWRQAHAGLSALQPANWTL
jgi:hypothetical protein